MANKKTDLFTILFMVLFLAMGIYSLTFTVEAIAVKNPPKAVSNKQLILDKSDFEKITDPTSLAKPAGDSTFGKSDPFAGIGQVN